MGSKPDEAWIMNRLIKQLTDMGFPVCGTNLHEIPVVCAPQFTHDTFLQFHSSSPLHKLKLVVGVSQRDPAEEALKSNNMNLDQAMSKFTNISSLSSLLPVDNEPWYSNSSLFVLRAECQIPAYTKYHLRQTNEMCLKIF